MMNYLKNYVRNETKLKKDNIELYLKINEYNSNFNNIIWSQKIYNFINNIKTPPVCGHCNNLVKFNRFSTGYSKSCSRSCHLKSKETIKKRKETNIERYGVENVFSSKEIQKKIKKINIQKYGVKNPILSKEIIKKRKETNIERYGVENVFSSKEIQKKIKATLNKNYGVNTPINNNLIKRKIFETININYRKKLSLLLNININNINILENNNILIKNFCDKHSEFEIPKHSIINRLNRSENNIKKLCTKCYIPFDNSSIVEKDIVLFIKETLGMEIENNNRNVLNGKELDIYIPTHNLAIEFNGLYWHSDLHKDQNYHLNKTLLCEEQGIQLLHVFEDEWIYKKEIIKSIIRSKLGLYDNKIYARKTKVVEITNNKLVREFLETNHLQGFVGSSVKLGLFYENELVSLMTFGKKRLAMGSKSSLDGEYEMLRFCNKLNTQIVGGASKLLKYFIKTYNPKYITSFADRRYSNGDLYKNLEFKYVGNTPPNYWYFKTNEMIRHHRFGFRKDVLVREGFDTKKTEREIMVERGYLRIYDCGNMKFELLL